MTKSAQLHRLVPAPRRGVVLPIESQILFLRKQKVILDSALAELYEVPVKRLNEQVKRNWQRFPQDFLFRLTAAEVRCLRSQFATSNRGRGGRRHLPLAFTEHGAIMAAAVMNSPRAVAMSVHVVRAFVRLRKMLAGNRELARRLNEVEQRLDTHDGDIQNLIDTIRRLMRPPSRPRRPIGFEVPGSRAASRSLGLRTRPERRGTM